MRRFVGLLCLFLPGLLSAEPVSFSGEVTPVLMKNCGYCHMREERYGYLVVEPDTLWASLVGVPAASVPSVKRVEPGEPDQSYLWLKLTGRHLEVGGIGWSMPFFPLPPAELETVRLWIEQGALDN